MALVFDVFGVDSPVAVFGTQHSEDGTWNTQREEWAKMAPS